MFKKSAWLFLAVLFLSTTILPGCGENQDYSITNIVLSDTKDSKTGLISEPKSVFVNSTNYIYGQAYLSNPVADKPTYIQIIWKYTQDKSNSIIHTNTLSTSQSATIAFKAQRPGFNWSQGSYLLEFVINDKTYATTTFTIGEVPIENAYIESIQTTASVDSYHNPTAPTSEFPATADAIYLTIATTNKMPMDTEVKVEWHYTQEQEFLSAATATLGPEEQDHFTLDKAHHQKFLLSNGNWRSGGYKARIYFDNKYIDEIRFNVS
ncbi:MAG: hypothetical protein WC570_05160 [Patescibacteria group bacterium]